MPARPCAACCDTGPDHAAAWIAAVGRVMWNMRKIHFSHSCKTAAARTAVKGARSLCVHRSGAETLDGHRSGGYAASAAPVPFATASVPNATLRGVECRYSPDALAACSSLPAPTAVYGCKRGEAYSSPARSRYLFVEEVQLRKRSGAYRWFAHGQSELHPEEPVSADMIPRHAEQ